MSGSYITSLRLCRRLLTGANAAKLGAALAGVEVLQETCRFDAGSRVTMGAEEVLEPHSFDLHLCRIEEGTQVMGLCDDVPVAVRTCVGNGEVIVLLSPFAINSECLVHGPVKSELEQNLVDPFVLTRHAEKYLSDLFGQLALFSVGEELGHVTCRRDAGRYELLVFNNTLEPTPLCIKSNVGRVLATREVSLGKNLTCERGYRPGGFEKTELGEDTDATVAGLSVRLFDITVKEEEIQELSAIRPPAPPTNRGLTLSNCSSIQESVLLRPAFDHHFDTVKVSWRYLASRDTNALSVEGAWLDRKGIRVITDFTDGLNYYPDLTLTDNCPGQWERSRDIILSVLEKLQAIGCRDAVIGLSRIPEAYFSNSECMDSYIRNMRTLCDEGEARSIRIHLQMRPRHIVKLSQDVLDLMSSIERKNLFFCLNSSHSLIEGEDILSVLKSAGDRCEVVLLSSPTKDEFGQIYNAHAPISSSDYNVVLQGLVQAAGAKTLVLDAVYDDRDAEFMDAISLTGVSL